MVRFVNFAGGNTYFVCFETMEYNEQEGGTKKSEGIEVRLEK